MNTKSVLLLGLPAALAGLGLSHATPSGNTEPPAPSGETTTPAGLVFGDVDGDGKDDAFVVSAEGQARLLMNFGAGRFEDVTLAANLAELGGATCALFADLDGDGRLDLFVGSSETRLWRNLGNATFEPMASGIEHDLVDLAAQAVDRDQDGRLDLQIHTEAGDLVYRNLGEGRFERLALPLGDLPQAPSHVGWIAPDSVATDPLAAPDAGTPAQRRLGRWVQGRTVGGFASAATSAPAGASSFGAPLPFLATCQPGVRDANGGACIGASSVPTLGKLYPLSSNLFVAPSGSVGMGTTAPDPAFALDIENTGSGVSWKGSIAAGGSAGQKVVLGQLNGRATVGAHTGALNAWSDLDIVADDFAYHYNVGTGNVTRLSVDGATGIVSVGNAISSYPSNFNGGASGGMAFFKPNGLGNALIGNYPGSESFLFGTINNAGNLISATLFHDALTDTSSVNATVKNFREANPDDPNTDIVYACVEGPEAAMYMRGTAQLVGGRARVALPRHFEVLAAAEGITVQLTPLSPVSRGLCVIEKSPGSFEVAELMQGGGTYEFDWEVKAVRSRFEDYQVIREKMWLDPSMRGKAQPASASAKDD